MAPLYLSPPIVEAWIEMVSRLCMTRISKSPPIVEAWIEIEDWFVPHMVIVVASHSGGVD